MISWGTPRPVERGPTFVEFAAARPGGGFERYREVGTIERPIDTITGSQALLGVPFIESPPAMTPSGFHRVRIAGADFTWDIPQATITVEPAVADDRGGHGAGYNFTQVARDPGRVGRFFDDLESRGAATEAERAELARLQHNQENWAEHRNRQGQHATLDDASAFADEALRKSARRQAVDELLADFEPEGFGKDEDDDPDEGLVRV